MFHVRCDVLDPDLVDGRVSNWPLNQGPIVSSLTNASQKTPDSCILSICSHLVTMSRRCMLSLSKLQSSTKTAAPSIDMLPWKKTWVPLSMSKLHVYGFITGHEQAILYYHSTLDPRPPIESLNLSSCWKCYGVYYSCSKQQVKVKCLVECHTLILSHPKY